MQAFSVSHWVDDVSDSDQKDISGLLLPRPKDLAVGEVAGPFRCIAKTIASLEGSHRGRWRSLVGVHGICGAKCPASAPKPRVGKQEKNATKITPPAGFIPKLTPSLVQKKLDHKKTEKKKK